MTTYTTNTTTTSSHSPSTARFPVPGVDSSSAPMHRSAEKANTTAASIMWDAQSVLEGSIHSDNYVLAKSALAYGANPNGLDQFGTSMLGLAITRNIRVVQLLLDHNADVDASDRLGKTAFDVIKECSKGQSSIVCADYKRIKEMLKEKQQQRYLDVPTAASAVPRPLKGPIDPSASMLENVIRHSDTHTLSYLLYTDMANLEERNKKGQKPLDVAREVHAQRLAASFFDPSGKAIKQASTVVAWLVQLDKSF